MIFNINALISGALAAANIFGAIPAPVMNAVSFSLCATTVGGYEQQCPLQVRLLLMLKIIRFLKYMLFKNIYMDTVFCSKTCELLFLFSIFLLDSFFFLLNSFNNGFVLMKKGVLLPLWASSSDAKSREKVFWPRLMTINWHRLLWVPKNTHSRMCMTQRRTFWFSSVRAISNKWSSPLVF